MIHLPDNDGAEGDYDVCDFAWFTIWCEDFNQTFTAIKIPRNIFVGCPLNCEGSTLFSFTCLTCLQVDKEEDVQLGKTIVCDVPEEEDVSHLEID